MSATGRPAITMDGAVEQRYDPLECARMCLNTGRICDLKHTPIFQKTGEMYFYDVKITRIRRTVRCLTAREDQYP